jgi:hypothetical protein
VRDRIIRTTASMAQTLVAVILGMLLTISVLILVSDDPTHEQLVERQQVILENQRLMLCLVLIEDRTEASVAECSTQTP